MDGSKRWAAKAETIDLLDVEAGPCNRFCRVTGGVAPAPAIVGQSRLWSAMGDEALGRVAPALLRAIRERR
jgi:hypothetical protein